MQSSEKNPALAARRAQQIVNNKRLGLVLFTIVATFFLGVVIKRALMG